MKAYAITLTDETVSTDATTKLIESNAKFKNDIQIEIMDAVIPSQVEGLMDLWGLWQEVSKLILSLCHKLLLM